MIRDLCPVTLSLLGAVALFALPACASEVPPPRAATESEWLDARTWLARLRATEPVTPFGAIVHVSFRDPFTGHTFSARGGVAVDPHHAVRVILLGPAGATAVDIWATPERWRFDVPALSLLRTGGRDDDPALPVGFFRWWFLSPVEGRLLSSFVTPRGERLILRKGAATVDLVDALLPDDAGHPMHQTQASRRAPGTFEQVSYRGQSLGINPGDRATYDEETSGVHVEVTVESSSESPDPDAFVDPDAPRGSKPSSSGT